MGSTIHDPVEELCKPGWVRRVDLWAWLEQRGVAEGEKLSRDNRTDGEIHQRFHHHASGTAFDFIGNWYSGTTWKPLVEWATQFLVIAESPKAKLADPPKTLAPPTRPADHGSSAGSPFLHLVPKTHDENLKFRKRVLREGYASKAAALELWIMCRRDLLFFINTFGWLINPRENPPKILPFITFQKQDGALLEMDAALGVEDVTVHKSRETGATWMALYLFLKRWMFHDHHHLGLVSRNEDAVDRADDPDSLMQKLDYVLDPRRMPSFLMPSFTRNKLKLTNDENESTIMGYSATGDVTRGGRKIAILMDEFAAFPAGRDYEALRATQHVSNTRLFVSTPDLPTGAYYDIVQKHMSGDSSKAGEHALGKFITLDWKDFPNKRAGLYTAEDGKLKILDEDYKFPHDYKFNLDGRVRSPYYDWECGRPGATMVDIARELDKDFGEGSYGFFDAMLIRRVRKEYVRPPRRRGYYMVDEEGDAKYVKNEDGPLLLWVALDANGNPPPGDYSVGIDVAAGTGGAFSSNSVAVAVDKRTGEQVAEFATPHMNPISFADWCKAFCKWFYNAIMVPEVTGPGGQTFINRIRDSGGYGNLYRRKIDADHTTKQKLRKFGWDTKAKNRPVLLGNYQAAMSDGKLIIRSAAQIDETTQYVMKDGIIIHATAAATTDESARGLAHGDRVIAGALAWEGIRDQPPPAAEPTNNDPPVRSWAWRRKIEEDREASVAVDSFDW